MKKSLTELVEGLDRILFNSSVWLAHEVSHGEGLDTVTDLRDICDQILEWHETH